MRRTARRGRIVFAVALLVGVAILVLGFARATLPFSYHVRRYPDVRCHPLDSAPWNVGVDGSCHQPNIRHLAQGVIAMVIGAAIIFGVALWAAVLRLAREVVEHPNATQDDDHVLE